MARSRSQLILGSRSPQRLELLRQIVPAERIEVLPPRVAEEAGFENLHDWAAIERRLIGIAQTKCDDVLEQAEMRAGKREFDAVVTADTIIVVTGAYDRLVVLGQPPDDESWTETVRHWFLDYYAGRTHVAATAFCVATAQGAKAARVVKSNVTFHAETKRWLAWYLATEEPRGKAGGYALQGAGGIFVSAVEGSLSNVIGLPLWDLFDVLQELGIDVG
jgi:septum formation protein